MTDSVLSEKASRLLELAEAGCRETFKTDLKTLDAELAKTGKPLDEELLSALAILGKSLEERSLISGRPAGKHDRSKSSTGTAVTPT